MKEEETTLEEILREAYTREDVTRAVLAREDQGEVPDLRHVKRALKAAPVLTLYAPQPLSRESVRAIGVWCRREVDPRILLDIRIDPHAAGGCLFAWQGVWHDYSLTRALEEKREAYTASITRLLTPHKSQP